VSASPPLPRTPAIGWGRVVLVVAVAVVGGLALVLAVHRLGAPALLLVAGAAVAAVLATRPGLVLTALLVPTVLFEASAGVFPPGGSSLFSPLPLGITPLELLFVLLLFAVVIDVSRRRELRLPEPFTLPLLLLVFAIVTGIINGVSNGASVADVRDGLRLISYLILMPFVVVNVVRDRRAVLIVAWAAALLAVIKSGFGVASLLVGSGVDIPGGVLTYYEPTANFLAMTFLLGVMVALVARVRLPVWAYGAVPLAILSLVLSYRRSFWIGTLIATVLVILVASGRVGRQYLLAGAAMVAIAVWVSLNVVTERQGPGAAGRNSSNLVVERLQSLNPASITQNAEDRYRIDERANVLDEIGAHPLFGIGLGVPWEATHPLSVEHDRKYVHFAALWYWLRLGILGLVAYVWLFATGMVASLRLWRRGDDPRLRVVGLAVFGGLVGLAVAETTGTFTGVDLRMTIVLAAVFGWLSVASRDCVEPAAPG
jgi:hypothetical protein